jgi:hypothetical protein
MIVLEAAQVGRSKSSTSTAMGIPEFVSILRMALSFKDIHAAGRSFGSKGILKIATDSISWYVPPLLPQEVLLPLRRLPLGNPKMVVARTPELRLQRMIFPRSLGPLSANPNSSGFTVLMELKRGEIALRFLQKGISLAVHLTFALDLMVLLEVITTVSLSFVSSKWDLISKRDSSPSTEAFLEICNMTAAF